MCIACLRREGREKVGKELPIWTLALLSLPLIVANFARKACKAARMASGLEANMGHVQTLVCDPEWIPVWTWSRL